MNARPKLVDIPGQVVQAGALSVRKAKQFASYLSMVGTQAFSRLHEVRRVNDSNSEAVVFSVLVERPQHLIHPIEREEWLAAIFVETDDTAPEVISLRPDFPCVPHTNLRGKGHPVSICLYDQPYEVVKLRWTPAEFLKRIHFWLARTATGTLHGNDQPLEPLIITSPISLILPSDFNTTDPELKPKPFNLVRIDGSPGQFTLRAFYSNSLQTQAASIAAVYWCRPQTHGVIRHQPLNLQDLQDLCAPAGLDIAAEIQTTIKDWYLHKPTPEILQVQFVIILVLPKTRQSRTGIESIETRAFLTGIPVGELGRRLGCLDGHGKSAGMIIGKNAISKGALEKINLCLLQVIHALSPNSAAHMNGAKPCESKIVAVGMGALGSQVYNNLARGGYGRWTLIDNDILLPHNCARHYLGDWAVGTNKAVTMAQIGNMILNDDSFAKAIPADILRPGSQTNAVDAALKSADVVFDISASVAVSRHLAKSKDCPRSISVFMTPKGDGLVIAAEDEKRRTRLDWLEMLHYRAVLNESVIAQSLQSNNSHLRYGNSCRDVSVELAQDDTAMWSGIAGKAIKQVREDKKPSLRIYIVDRNGTVNLIKPSVHVPRVFQFHDWSVYLDDWLLEKLFKFRSSRLPNETGGVLLGAFDTHNQSCMIIDALPSPPDSTEWPRSYIRGCEGLAAKVREIENLTLSQVGYVGEWHSHPMGASSRPSSDDLQAYKWLAGHMHLDSLPGLMVIIGDRKRICLVSSD